MARDRKQPTVATLIDGYNLMFQSIGAPDARRGSLALREARQYCLAYIAARMSEWDRSRTWIVFDSQADLEHPKELLYRRLRVTFSRDHSSADELIIQAVRSHPTPKKLTVVSSDHQIQKAAMGRGAIVMESEDWVTHRLASQIHESTTAGEVGNDTGDFRIADGELTANFLEEKPTDVGRPMDPKETREWLDRFGYS
jgi:predicted RNA-binding protein with PIN domain